MASSGGGRVRFYLKIFWGGFSFETLHFFENHRPPTPPTPPEDVINDRSLNIHLQIFFEYMPSS